MTFRLEPAAFAAWLDRYREAWEERDPDRAASLFTDDASYRETPFDPPMEGSAAIHAYWAKAVAGQSDIRFTSEVLACAGADGLCHWHCAFAADPAGDRIDLDGIFRCRFADETRVEAFEEWWHIKLVPAG